MRYVVECCGKTVSDFETQYEAELAALVLQAAQHRPTVVDTLAV